MDQHRLVRSAVRWGKGAVGLALVTIGCSGEAPDALEPNGPPVAAAEPLDATSKVPSTLIEALRAGHARDVIVLLDAPFPAVPSEEIEPVESDDVAPSAASPDLERELAGKSSLYSAATASFAREASAQDISLRHTYRFFPMVHAKVGSLAALESLSRSRLVIRVYEDARFELSLSQSRPLINQPTAFLDGRAGAGTSVAVLDTGCDYKRSAFGSCSAAGAEGCKVAYSVDMAADDGSRDDNGHGTNVSAIVLGVAPEAKIVALDVFDGPWAYSSSVLAAIDWVIANRAAYGIAAMNMSFGGGLYGSPCAGYVLAAPIAVARAAGVLSAVAAGNSASSVSLSAPACAPAAVSVGAVYDASVGVASFGACSDATTSADAVTCFSNSAPFLTMLAPGAFVTAGGYTYAGTSQAAPHVAGAIAVLRSMYPTGSATTFVTRLTSSGRPITDGRNGIVKPRLDLAATACSAIVRPSSKTVAASGGRVKLTISTGPSCTWSTLSRASWLTVEPGSKGTGTVVLTVAPNSGSARVSTLTVAKRKITITQEGSL